LKDGKMNRRGGRSKQTHFPLWASDMPGGEEKRFIQIGVSLLEHESFLNLTPGAKVLYFYMKWKADPKPEFELPHKDYSIFTDNRAFSRACKELVEAGFIEVLQHNQCVRKPNRYKFSAAWKNTSIKKGL
jgi:hypothetical protein